MKKSNIESGTVIHSTMRPEDLIPAFVEFLQGIEDNHHGELIELVNANKGKINYFESDEADFDLEDLFYALNEYAPDGHYFGAHPGDGADFGFWQCEEM